MAPIHSGWPVGLAPAAESATTDHPSRVFIGCGEWDPPRIGFSSWSGQTHLSSRPVTRCRLQLHANYSALSERRHLYLPVSHPKMGMGLGRGASALGLSLSGTAPSAGQAASDPSALCQAPTSRCQSDAPVRMAWSPWQRLNWLINGCLGKAD